MADLSSPTKGKPKGKTLTAKEEEQRKSKQDLLRIEVIEENFKMDPISKYVD